MTWMLAPFIKFLNVVSYSGLTPPKVVHKDDSVTLKVSQDILLYMTAAILHFPLVFQPFEPKRLAKWESLSRI